MATWPELTFEQRMMLDQLRERQMRAALDDLMDSIDEQRETEPATADSVVWPCAFCSTGSRFWTPTGVCAAV